MIPILLVAGILAAPGEWVTTPSGEHVCRLTMGLSTGQVLWPSFCENWQPGFPRPQVGQTYPVEQGWIRFDPVGGKVQIHVENRWVP